MLLVYVFGYLMNYAQLIIYVRIDKYIVTSQLFYAVCVRKLHIQFMLGSYKRWLHCDVYIRG